MAERRSMDAAMALPENKIAFIHEGKTAAQSGRGAENTEAAEGLRANVRAPRTQPTAKGTRIKRRGRRPKEVLAEPSVSSAPMSEATSSFLPPLLVGLTTRLSPATAESLRRAVLEQRLQRRRPHTQQEIVEAAVSHWLRANGFLTPA